jgi:hypothetical protein
MVPESEGGLDEIDNAIPVCFECHAEIHSYNDKHPRGRKFLAEELRAHKEQWLKMCFERPDVLVTASRTQDVGPLQALIDELEFNEHIQSDSKRQGCKFRDQQFARAVHEGSISILRDELRELLLAAYQAMGAANAAIESVWVQPSGSNEWATATREASIRIDTARPLTTDAREELLKFLSSEGRC